MIKNQKIIHGDFSDVTNQEADILLDAEKLPENTASFIMIRKPVNEGDKKGFHNIVQVNSTAADVHEMFKSLIEQRPEIRNILIATVVDYAGKECLSDMVMQKLTMDLLKNLFTNKF